VPERGPEFACLEPRQEDACQAKPKVMIGRRGLLRTERALPLLVALSFRLSTSREYD